MKNKDDAHDDQNPDQIKDRSDDHPDDQADLHLPSFNPELFMEKMDHNSKIAKKMIGIFLKNAPPAMARLTSAIQRNDPNETFKSAHYFKGMIAYYSNEGEETAYAIEDMGRNNKMENIPQLLNQLTAIMEHLIPDIEQFYKKLDV